MRRPAAILIALVALSAAFVDPAIAEPEASEDEAKKTRAKEHFDRGNELLAEGDNEAALAEFLRSREVFPTRGNTLNAAVVLRKLGRYDESLEMFERLLAEFPNMEPAELADVKNEIDVLKTRIGTLEIRSEDGATVYVDNRERGTTPLTGPLTVSAGSRVVRVVKAGRLPYERRIEIAGRQNVTLDVELRRAAETTATPPPRVPPTRDPDRAPPAPAAARPFVALDAGLLVTNSFGGELRARCEDPCDASVPFGFGGFLSAGVALASGLDVGAEIGLLRVGATYEDRTDPLRLVGWSGQGRARDDLTLSAIAIGGTLALRTGESLPVTFGLSMGVLAASMRAERGGSYDVESNDGSQQLTIDLAAEQTARGWYAYVGPEVRLGFPIAEQLEIGIFVEVLVALALSTPEWDDETALARPGDVGLIQFAPDTLTGNVIVFAMPGVGARYVF